MTITELRSAIGASREEMEKTLEVSVKRFNAQRQQVRFLLSSGEPIGGWPMGEVGN